MAPGSSRWQHLYSLEQQAPVVLELDDVLRPLGHPEIYVEGDDIVFERYETGAGLGLRKTRRRATTWKSWQVLQGCGTAVPAVSEMLMPGTRSSC